ncbi:MAG: VWA domain-containing protein [Bacteroidetes bacterium]|nr:VWA domain-containing protein [Bacteroidota bacterium]
MLTHWNIKFWEYSYLQPPWLILIVLIPLFLYFSLRRERTKTSDLRFSGTLKTQRKVELKWVKILRQVILFLQAASFLFIIVALAKPFRWDDFNNSENEYKNGIDIILAMDVSGSMMATDFIPNRLEVAKKVAKSFINDRKGDRIGLVAYSEEAYTACPATLDYEVLKKQIDEISPNLMGKKTAIGIGLGTAVARLRNDSLPSKVIILLTDGSNNAGEIDPITAASLAKAKNIRVYTIGVGSNDTAMIPEQTSFGIVNRPFQVDIDEETLNEIAKTTGGEYFRATDEKSLEEIYIQIDEMEKLKILNNKYKKTSPATPYSFLNFSLLLLVLSFAVDRIIFKSYA